MCSNKGASVPLDKRGDPARFTVPPSTLLENILSDLCLLVIWKDVLPDTLDTGTTLPSPPGKYLFSYRISLRIIGFTMSTEGVAPPKPRKTYEAGCHCGYIKFAVTLSPPLPETKPLNCDCSACRRFGYLLVCTFLFFCLYFCLYFFFFGFFLVNGQERVGQPRLIRLQIRCARK